MNLPKPCGFQTVWQNKRKPVTICIAAIAEHGLIVGCSDTMMTDEDKGIQFELMSSSSGSDFINKISPITTNIAALTAGAAGLQAEILLEMIFRCEKSGGKKWLVREVVDLYCECFGNARRKRIENSILKPLGLNFSTFISQQKSMDSEFVQRITNEILGFQFSGVQTIITGVDEEGSHIYTLNDDAFHCNDTIGFSAIGSGAIHAESQFMLAGYNRLFTQEDAMWLLYLAKRKSEVAPGVGKDTHFISISQKDRKVKFINDVIDLGGLFGIYHSYEIEQMASFDKGKAAFKSHFEKLSKKNKSI